MKSGAAVLLAILLGVFLAVGQCGTGSADDKDHSSSSASDDHEDKEASHDDNSDDDSEHDDKDKQEDDGDHDEESADKDSDDKDSGDKDSESAHAEALKQHLEDQGLRVQQVSTDTDGDCAAHSYGEVHNYFSDHQCQGLERAWYEIGDDADNKALLSVAWVEMSNAESAADLQRLVDRPGTGNVTELSKEDGPYQDVSYSGWYYRSGRDGNTFHSVQAEPLTTDQGSRELARRASGATAVD